MHRIIVLILLGGMGFLSIVGADDQKPAPMLGTEAGQVRDDNGLKMKLVWCPPGALIMGRNQQTHAAVVLSRGNWMGKHEVTQAEWSRVMATEPWTRMLLVRKGADFPATYVNSEDATRFCRKFTEQERTAGRLSDDWEYTLPTEAQWEHACRAGSVTEFSFGDDAADLGEYAWFEGTAADAKEDYAHPVAQKKANAWGLHDMHGNVAEWCRDFYSENLPGGRDPEVKRGDIPMIRSIRGGAWRQSAARCRTAARAWSLLEDRNSETGFRVALTPVRPAAENPAK